MSLALNSNGIHDPTLSYADAVAEELPHVDAEVAVQLLSAQITLVCRSEVAS